MRTLYLDCGMGAAGDMLTAALAELLPDKEAFFAELNALGIPGVSFLCEPAEKCGIRGTHVRVTVNGVEEDEEMHDGHGHPQEPMDHHHDDHHERHDHHHEHDHHDHDHDHYHDHEHHHDHDHHHHHEHDHNHDHDHDHDHHHHHGHHHGYRMAEIGQIVKEMQVSEKVKADILAVYGLIAEAESHVHGKTVEEIHFHEVGTMDAVADVTAVCMLMDRLAPERVIASPVHVGCGQVKCAHGILPVPAPATAYILRDVPVYGGSIDGELCTPTGAALLKHFVTEFGSMPVMRTERIGYGMGKKDFPAANCVRALLGQTQGQQDQIVELRCNIDDMTAEALAHASEVFFAAGALDVYTIPIQMKKSRVGMLLTVMCREKDRDSILPLMFRHTSTLGVRESISRRHTLSRKMETVSTEYGEVRKKVSSGYGITKEKYEYEDLAAIAGKTGMSVDEVRDMAKKADEA